MKLNKNGNRKPRNVEMHTMEYEAIKNGSVYISSSKTRGAREVQFLSLIPHPSRLLWRIGNRVTLETFPSAEATNCCFGWNWSNSKRTDIF